MVTAKNLKIAAGFKTDKAALLDSGLSGMQSMASDTERSGPEIQPLQHFKRGQAGDAVGAYAITTAKLQTGRTGQLYTW